MYYQESKEHISITLIFFGEGGYLEVQNPEKTKKEKQLRFALYKIIFYRQVFIFPGEKRRNP